MKYLIITLILFINFNICGQPNEGYSKKLMEFEATKDHPYGKPNKFAPEEVKDFDTFIGVCDCKSLQYKTGIANDTLPLLWKWKYILNGNAVQDEGWFGNDDKLQSSFTSIRILNPQTKKWNVPFFVPQLRTDPQIWNGGKEGANIVLKKIIPTKSDDVIESILTFSNITDRGFEWEGKIVNATKNTSQVFWKIWCKKRRE